MKRRGILAAGAALVTLLLCLLLPRLLPARRQAEFELRLWYSESDADPAAMEALAERCERETGVHIVTRSFPDEQALAAACSGERPELLWCSHVRAFDMAQNGALAALPAELAHRGEGAEGFYALGARLPLLLRNTERMPQAPADWESLLSAGERETLAADCWADLLFEAMYAQGSAMTGLRSADRVNRSYLRLHNLLAEAAYAGSAVNLQPAAEAVLEGRVAAAAVDSAQLAGLTGEGLAVDPLPLPKGAAARYAVVQMGFAQMRESTAVETFLRWLSGQGRDGEAALSLGLVPRGAVSGKGKTPLESTLRELARTAELSAADPGSSYLQNRADCEDWLRLSFELLA